MAVLVVLVALVPGAFKADDADAAELLALVRALPACVVAVPACVVAVDADAAAAACEATIATRAASASVEKVGRSVRKKSSKSVLNVALVRSSAGSGVITMGCLFYELLMPSISRFMAIDG